ncbi:MAG: quinone-dependent dihydroorotate dehydrogenase [Limnohabitans sp.]|nr:quinone-dependent dihydroorotate dehydrogenase [Limnohabitans sp.]
MSALPYSLLRPLLFAVDAETVHDRTMDMLAATQHTGLRRLYRQTRVNDPVTLCGLSFPNRIGLAAGLDKNARCIDAWQTMGFGFVEVGTVTPLAQPGNPKPRMFRLPQAQALINRLGFNNQGLESFLNNVSRAGFRRTGDQTMLLGLNIGKNAATPIDKANDDYLRCLDAVYPHADYVTVNISSPNTKNLRQLQTDEAFTSLLQVLQQRRRELAGLHGKHVPVFIKIAPDLDDTQLQQLCASLRAVCMRGEEVIDQAWGVIATNTTLSRDAVQGMTHGAESGGLSGAPVREASNRIIRFLRGNLGPQFPVIGVGGVMTAADAVEKIKAGADLVQIYTGLIYAGPSLIPACALAIQQSR